MIKCKFDDESDNETILNHSSDRVKHIDILLDRRDATLVAYVLICISNVQLDNIKQSIVEYNKCADNVIYHIICLLLVNYNRTDIIKLMVNWICTEPFDTYLEKLCRR